MKWKLENRKLSSLKEYDKNPRQLSKAAYAQLKKSLEKFGLIDKPIINTDNTIIGGHQRIKVLKDMGVKEVECYVPEVTLTEKEVQQACVTFNKATGDWDWDTLANEWEPLDLIEYGFTQEELVGHFAKEIEPEEEDQTGLEPTKDPKTKLGDIYELGDLGHRLVCGDSTLPDTVTSCLLDNVPILMVTDPPYGVEYDPKWREVAGKGCGAKGKVQNDDKVNWSLAWHLFPGSVAYVWHAPSVTHEVQKSLIDSEYKIINQIIWVKQHFALSRGDYHWHHESCWYAVKEGQKHNWQGARDQSTVWEIANLGAFGKNQEDERTAHSTQKPLECMARPIRNNTAKGEAVYDPFLGSGTTLIAAESLERTCYGIELDPAYCDMAVERWIRNQKKNNKPSTVIRNGEIFKDLG